MDVSQGCHKKLLIRDICKVASSGFFQAVSVFCFNKMVEQGSVLGLLG